MQPQVTLSCQLCYKIYSCQDKKSLTLPCSHTFCFSCINNQLKDRNLFECSKCQNVYNSIKEILQTSNKQEQSGEKEKQQEIQPNMQNNSGSQRNISITPYSRQNSQRMLALWNTYSKNFFDLKNRYQRVACH